MSRDTSSTEPSDEVRAAGGVIRRRAPSGIRRGAEVLLVHRPKYDDWSFPKGKRDGSETDEQTALREVEEETGFRCTLADDLGFVEYFDAYGRHKTVHYWLMDLESGDGEHFVPNREVDEVHWCAPRRAARLLSYDHDRVLIERIGGKRA